MAPLFLLCGRASGYHLRLGRRAADGGWPIDPVEQFRLNFLAACHFQDAAVPVASSSIISTSTSHSEDYPSPAVTEYLDEGLEAARLVPCAEVKKVIEELGRDKVWFRHYLVVRALDLARNPPTAKEVGDALGVKERRLLGMRREFWEAVYGKVTARIAN